MGKCRFCGCDLDEQRLCYVLRSGFRICAECYDFQQILSIPDPPDPSSVLNGSF